MSSPTIRQATDGHLEVERGWSVEKLSHGAVGVEQSWTFTGRPEGQDDVVLRVAVDGQRYAGSTSLGLHFFSDQATGLGLRYGIARWIDARGASTEIRPTFEDGTIVMRVPRALVDGSAYPATLDPTVSATETNTDTPVSISSGGANLQAEPGVAFDGTNFFAVWTDNRSSSLSTGDAYDVWGARIDQAGNLLDSPAIDLVTAANIQDVPSVAFGGGQYFAAWTDTRSGDSCCSRVPFGARVSTGGTVMPAPGTVAAPGGIALNVDDPAPINPPPGGSADDSLAPPTIAADGSDALVLIGAVNAYKCAWLHGDGSVSGVSGRHCNVNGPPGAQACSTFFTTSLAPDGSGNPKGCSTDNDCTGPADGAPYGYPTGSTFAGCQAIANAAAPFAGAAFNGTQYLIAWSDSRAGGIYAGLVNPLSAPSNPGAILNPVNILGSGCTCGGCATIATTGGIQVATAAASGANPTVASNGDGFLVAWADSRTTGAGQGIYAQVLDRGGNLVGPQILAATTTGANSLVAPSATFDGTNYVIAWGSLTGATDPLGVKTGTLQATRVSPSGASLDTSPANIESDIDLDQNVSDTITGGTGYPGRGFALASNGTGRTLFVYARYDSTETLSGAPVDTIRVHARFWDDVSQIPPNPSSGVCTNPTAADGTACNDGNACTQTDRCVSGTCTGSNPVTCAASDQCHVAGTCNPSTGACSTPAAPDGTVCNDGNPCTQTDTCVNGTCTGSNPVTCTAGDQCHIAGMCNPSTGACSTPAAPDGTACNDANACTQTDTCVSGACTGSSPVTCTAIDQCHLAGECNPVTGACSTPAAPDGTACNDGNACTTADACTAGVCGGSPVTPILHQGSDQTVVGGCTTAAVTFTPPTVANAGCGAQATVSCTSIPGNSYGPHTVRCNATTASGSTSQAVTFTVSVLQPLTVQVQPPLYGDNDSRDNLVKAGSTVPTKVLLYACGTNVTTTAPVTAKLGVTFVPGGGATATVDVPSFNGAGDTNGIMVMDGTYYRYNVATSGFAVTANQPGFYQVSITVAYQSAPSVIVGTDAIQIDTK
jgi:hypothetical protein